MKPGFGSPVRNTKLMKSRSQRTVPLRVATTLLLCLAGAWAVLSYPERRMAIVRMGRQVENPGGESWWRILVENPGGETGGESRWGDRWRILVENPGGGDPQVRWKRQACPFVADAGELLFAVGAWVCANRITSRPVTTLRLRRVRCLQACIILKFGNYEF